MRTNEKLAWQSQLGGSASTANGRVPPRCGEEEAAPAIPVRASKTAQQVAVKQRRSQRRSAGPSAGARVGSFFIAISSERGCRLRRGLSGRTGLPPAVLLEEVFLFLSRHRRTAGRTSVLIDEMRKHRLQIVRLGRVGDLHVALQPLLGGLVTVPAGQLGGKVHLTPLRMVAGFQQRLKPGEEHIDELGD